jgi:hypothetical protein
MSYELAKAPTPIVPPSGSGLIGVFYRAAPASVLTTSGPILARS